MSSVCSYESSEEDSSEDLNIIHRFDQVSTSSLEIEDVQEAINGVKRTILETDVSSQSRKDLVHKLIRLRIKKEDLENRKHFEVSVASDKLCSVQKAIFPLHLASWRAGVSGPHHCPV